MARQERTPVKRVRGVEVGVSPVPTLSKDQIKMLKRWRKASAGLDRTDNDTVRAGNPRGNNSRST